MFGAQVALTLLMLTAAASAGKGFLHLVNMDLGYDPHQTMSVPIPISTTTRFHAMTCPSLCLTSDDYSPVFASVIDTGGVLRKV